MTCAQAHRILGAYRRDDWSPADLEAFGQHLAGCAECRRVEATYRQVGEHIRQLPSITPPPALRAAVFAAIRAEAAQGDRTLEQMTSDQTQPHLPVIRSGRQARYGMRPGRPITLGARSAVAVAAVLLLSLCTARLLPALAGGVSNIARGIASGPLYLNGGGAAATPHIEHYATNAQAGPVTGAMASARWLVYVTADQSGHDMLYAQDRATRRTVPLLTTPSETPLTVVAISDRWVLWLAGTSSSSAPWTLWASSLAAATQASAATALTVDLATSAPATMPSFALASNSDSAPDAPALLSGVWLNASTVLAAEVTQGGSAQVVRLALTAGETAPTAQIVARALQPGHLLTNPSAVGSTYFWAEVWADGGTGLHSDVWQGDGVGQARQVTTSANAFAPHAADHTLLWVQPGGTVALDATTDGHLDQAADAALAKLGGTLRAQDLSSGHARQLAANVAAATLAVAWPLVVWRDGNVTHTYDLAHNGPSAVEAQVRFASFADASGNALVWGDAGSTVINVYDGH